MNEDLLKRLTLVELVLADMERKVEELWSRPRMPYTQGANSGDILKLEADPAGSLVPIWGSIPTS